MESSSPLQTLIRQVSESNAALFAGFSVAVHLRFGAPTPWEPSFIKGTRRTSRSHGMDSEFLVPREGRAWRGAAFPWNGRYPKCPSVGI
jgi:hypothetical protein